MRDDSSRNEDDSVRIGVLEKEPMIDDINYMHHDKVNLPLDKAHELIQQLPGEPSLHGQLLNERSLTMLDHDVYRVTLEANGGIRTWIIKRFANKSSKLERLVITQWLPNASLAHICPILLGVAPESTGERVWHIYEDLGDYALDQEQAQGGKPVRDRGFLTPLLKKPDQNHVDLLIHLMADVHERFMDDALLDEYRSCSTDLGGRCYRKNVRDAVEELEALKDSQLAETEPALQHPSGAKFVGAEKCGECHTKAFEKWSETGHASAFDSLREGRRGIPRMFDPECLSCHVTGWHPQQVLRYDSGYINEKLSAHLLGNQCENCHGPGSKHIELIENDDIAAARKLVKVTLKQAQTFCYECHDLDNSPHFVFEEYWPKVAHPGLD